MSETVENHMELRFEAKSVNESLARMAVAAFLTDMNPTLSEVDDVKTAVSEAVTNAIVHGYSSDKEQVIIRCSRRDRLCVVQVEDEGVGISDVKQARLPFFTTKPEQNRSGMGFSFMETFMDQVEVESTPGRGTKVTMTKYIAGGNGR